ncbi:MAG: sel1 repeat family protein [Lamprobacter sp.]|uniref:tetratricopeptide repeat protein n=1 Tax=Lamprobacter sp. TaxID=3100796 RepID=UPI002B25DA39|nr:sel1 repeat family protein [Lamprobacter sp.]MEA3640549.1 sel1 repeat family protein [Lamprobacter sp.]
MFSIQPIGLRLALSILVSMGVTTACVSNPSAPVQIPTNASGNLDDLMLVDCLLPSQVRQLGTKMTYMAPRRYIKTTKTDCGIRGGEFVLYDRSDYRSALQTLLPKAESGDPVAQTYVGEIYEKGLGLPKPDYAAAASWYRKAAQAGHQPAQTNLGTLYERGLGVTQDKAAALNWYRKATGVAEDNLMFESRLKAERAAYQRELAVRNQVVSSLRSQLQTAKARSASSVPATQTTTASAPPANKQAIERVATSLKREAASEAEQINRQIHAVKEVRKAEELREASSATSSKSGKKSAQMGKLELTLREQQRSLVDTENRLSMLVP